MKKEEKEFTLGGHKARITARDPAEKKRINKLNAMRIAQTHIEIQGLKATPKKAINIADEFLEWLKK